MGRVALALMIALMAGLPGTAVGQTPDPLAPLEKYLGTWTYEGRGNGARGSCRSERRWIANRSYVESHRQCDTVNGPITQVALRPAAWRRPGQVRVETNPMNVLVLMLGTVATWVLHAWFGRGWWLNSGAAVREVMLGLAVLGALAGTTIPEVNIRGSQFMVRAFYLWLGVLLALFIAFVRMGGFSGSIFPIVLAFMVVMSGVAVAVGYSVGLGARMSIRRLLAHKA